MCPHFETHVHSYPKSETVAKFRKHDFCVNFVFLHLGGRIFYSGGSWAITEGHINTTAGTWYFDGNNGYTYRATLDGWNMVGGTATRSSVFNVWANYSPNQQQHKRPIV